MAHGEYSLFFFVCPLFAALFTLLSALLGCTGCADHRSIRDSLAVAADAVEARDAERLFDALDERERFALWGIVQARRQARQLIEAEYPDADREEALSALGDAAEATATTGAALFAHRCDQGCVADFARWVGAPVSQVLVGDEIEVTTVRGHTLHMHAGKNGQYGIVWNWPELSEEVSQASRELTQIQENAAVYRRRRELRAQPAHAAAALER
jgi:hypothetical protein